MPKVQLAAPIKQINIMSAEQKNLGHCKIMYKGKLREAEIVEQKKDKVKVQLTEEQSDWFENREIKRIWK